MQLVESNKYVFFLCSAAPEDFHLDDYTCYHGSCYSYRAWVNRHYYTEQYTYLETWQKAEENCQSEGGTLININTRDEAEMLKVETIWSPLCRRYFLVHIFILKLLYSSSYLCVFIPKVQLIIVNQCSLAPNGHLVITSAYELIYAYMRHSTPMKEVVLIVHIQNREDSSTIW